MILGAIGTIGVIVSMFLPWRTGSVYPSDVPAAFLWDRTTGTHDPSLLIFLIPLAVILLVGTLVPMGAGARFVGSVGVLIVTGVFAYQLNRTVSANSSLGDVLDTGFYFAAIGALIGLVSAILTAGRHSPNR
jgi:hypothetical protein